MEMWRVVFVEDIRITIPRNLEISGIRRLRAYSACQGKVALAPLRSVLRAIRNRSTCRHHPT